MTHHCDDPHCTEHHHGHEHHCDDPHCSDPHCTEHHHGHEHGHHCDDPHCSDPHCTEHHHGHETAEHAAVFAAQRAFAPAVPVPRAALEKAALSVFRAIGESCCIDGILPGHAKGLVEAGGGALSLSLTSLDRVDAKPVGDWATEDDIPAFTVTLNVHLIVPRPLDGEALFAPFAAL